MNARDLILLDLRETRRRFFMVASSFPDHLLHWRPDPDALSVGGHIRHVLLHDLDWLYIFEKGRLPTEQEHEPIWERPPLGDTLERKAYHDAVHTGQLLQYLRMLQLPRPGIWD